MARAFANPAHRRPFLLGSFFRGLSFALIGFFAFSSAPDSVQGQPVQPTEYQVKAAYLFNFGKFVTWPEEVRKQRQTFQLCVLGPDPFGSVLDDTIRGEKLDGKTVAARRLSSAVESASCAIVFISTAEQHRLSFLIPLLQRQHVLTVSDIPHFVDHGGDIGFVATGGRIRFEVNQSAAEEAGLSLSSELLKVATSVRKGGK
ncbi:MAG: YfiR family protein [Candidatus Angelobacter sp.]